MPETLIRREHYLRILHRLKDKPIVKIITGVRGCGKSALVEMFISDLKKGGISERNILYMDLEERENSGIKYGDTLLMKVEEAVELKKGTYLFFEGIQNITDWEKAVSVMRYSGADIYITGSNAKLFTPGLSVHLSEEYAEVGVYPLSFREYVDFMGRNGDRDQLLQEYMAVGGMPQAVFEGDTETNGSIPSAIFEKVFIRDVVEKNRIMDVAVIRDIAEFVMKNVGNTTSSRNISDHIASKGGKITPPTADSYLDHLESAYLLYRARKYDTETEEYLRTANKFYSSDLGIRNKIAGYESDDTSGLIDNIVFMELLFRGKKAAVGKVGNNKVDFVVIGSTQNEYYQVTTGLFDPDVLEKEVRPLKGIDDGSPRTIITLQRYTSRDIGGIKVVSLTDFLLEEFE